MIVVSEGMQRHPELVDRICDNDGLGLMPPQAGFVVEKEEIEPEDWTEAVAWLHFRHQEDFHIQLASEPFPNEFPPEGVMYLAEILQESTEEFSTEFPELEYPVEAADEIELLRRRAVSKTHDIRPEDMRSIIQAARDNGCTRGAVTAMVMEICEGDRMVAGNLMAPLREEWRKCVTPEQARAIINFAREQGADQQALEILNDAMGCTHREGGLKNNETNHAAWNAVEKASEEARMDWYVTQRALLVL